MIRVFVIAICALVSGVVLAQRSDLDHEIEAEVATASTGGTLSSGGDADAQIQPSLSVIERRSMQIAEQDLVQQTRMAESTHHMMLISCAALFLSSIAVVFVAVTVYFTKKAAIATEETLRLAQRSLGETEKATGAALAQARQDRAWVAFSGVRGSFTKGKDTFVRIEVSNTGGTPAKDVTVVFRFGDLRSAEDPRQHFPAQNSKPLPSATIGILPPNLVVPIPIAIPGEAMKKLNDKTFPTVLELSMTVEYETVYGVRGKTIHSLSISKQFDDAGRFTDFYVAPTDGEHSAE